MGKRPCVEFFHDGRNFWKNGIIGKLLRKRGMFISGVVILSTMGTPWYVNNQFFDNTIEFSIIFRTIFLFFVVFFGLIIFFGLLYLRNRTLRSLRIKYSLHDIEHSLRDHQTDFFDLEEEYRSTSDDNKLNSKTLFQELHNKLFIQLLKDICRKSKDYFRLLCKDSSIEIGLRLAEEESPDGDIVYVTKCRTSGLNKGRENTSEPLSIKEGIPGFFIKNNGGENNKCFGLLIYHDIIEAIRVGAMKKTKSEETFKNDMTTMMVAPLNAWSGDSQTIIGIFYITSREKNTFSEKYTDSALFIGDMISKSIAFAVSVRQRIER
jgi:hypothetical protein